MRPGFALICLALIGATGSGAAASQPQATSDSLVLHGTTNRVLEWAYVSTTTYTA